MKHFDFSLGTYKINGQKELKAYFSYTLANISEETLLVKPTISNGFVEVLDAKTGEWVSSNNAWSKMPHIQKEMKLKIRETGFDQTQLYFEILDLSTSKVYITSTKPIWGSYLDENYFSSLNRHLVPSNFEFYSASHVSDIPNRSYEGLIALCVTVFIVSVSVKIKKWKNLKIGYRQLY